MVGVGLYFVGDQQDVVLVVQGVQVLYEGFGVDVEVIFVLYWFDDDCGDVLGLGIVFEDVFDVGDGVVFVYVVQFVGCQGVEDVVWYQVYVGGVWDYFVGQVQGYYGVVVVCVGEGDYVSVVGGGVGDFDGVFYGFGVGGDQQGFFWEVVWYVFGDFFGQFDVGFVGQYLEVGVGQFVQLFLDCGDYFWMQVVGVQYGDVVGEVDVFVVFYVLDGGVFGVFGDDWVDLVYVVGYCGLVMFQQGFVGFVYGFFSGCLLGWLG